MNKSNKAQRNPNQKQRNAMQRKLEPKPSNSKVIQRKTRKAHRTMQMSGKANKCKENEAPKHKLNIGFTEF